MCFYLYKLNKLFVCGNSTLRSLPDCYQPVFGDQIDKLNKICKILNSFRSANLQD